MYSDLGWFYLYVYYNTYIVCILNVSQRLMCWRLASQPVHYWEMVEPGGRKLGYWGMCPWRGYWNLALLCFSLFASNHHKMNRVSLLWVPAMMCCLPLAQSNRAKQPQTETAETVSQINLSSLWADYLRYFAKQQKTKVTS
jgi:hypothetical protein